MWKADEQPKAEGAWSEPQHRRQSLVYQTPVLLDEQAVYCKTNLFFRAIDVLVSISTSFTRNISKKSLSLVCKQQFCRSVPSVVTYLSLSSTTFDHLSSASACNHSPSTAHHTQYEFIMWSVTQPVMPVTPSSSISVNKTAVTARNVKGGVEKCMVTLVTLPGRSAASWLL